MALTREDLEAALKDLGLAVETDGEHYLHTTQGRWAPVISTVISLDEDGSGVTIVAVLSESTITPDNRPAVYELLNLVHGQDLWNVRFHVDEEGRVVALGRHSLWGNPFNAEQFEDVVFSLIATTDRLSPCIDAICKESVSAEEAFSKFFVDSN